MLRSKTNLAPTPRPNSIQIQQLAQVTPEPRSPIRGSRSEDHGPICLDLGPWTVVQGSGFKQDINTSIYGRLGVTPARAEHYAFPKSGNERGNNSEHKKAASNMRRLGHWYNVIFIGCGGRI